MSEALHLGPSQQFELLRNRAVGTSPTMPALDRYTGVLFDALAAETLPRKARTFADGRVLIHSALFGLLGAEDPIPAYRLSHDSRLPELSLKRVWRQSISNVLSNSSDLIIDMRSEAYVALGPAPGSYFLRLIAESGDGRRRALNHFNKKGKGEFVRALLTAGIDHPSLDSLLEWASRVGFALSVGPSGELELLVPEVAASRAGTRTKE
jgi:cytoplasmic iron level regulating protein YaaA (DUF328/UPF0246 family)